jgi:uncharacterized protein with NAD-binding domain and iron-sulfur cluster
MTMVENNASGRHTRRRKKIAILGGGLGGLAAAYELTSQPRWYERYEIAIYQKGWRLGGKGASGRGENGRIEEHGLHCFWGFYDNAFRMLRTCYEEIDRQSGPIRTLDDAFRKLSAVWFIDRKDGEWRRYEMHFPENSERPGEGIKVTEMGVTDLVARYLRQVKAVLAENANLKQVFEDIVPAIDEQLDWLEQFWRGVLSDLSDDVPGEAGRLLERLARAEPEPIDGEDRALRRETLYYAVRLAFTIALGLLRDGIPTSLEGFDDERFDSHDLREWLASHGASEDLLRSQVVTGLYNASFCYPGGDFDHPNLSAGVSLRTLLLMGFTYKGAFMWKMQGCMGDVVFAPIYEALVRRGEEADREMGTRGSVTFEFFHKVTNLSVGPDASSSVIDAIEIDEQAITKHGTYDPLIVVRDLHAWPASPRYEQLVDGDALMGFDLESDWCSVPPARKHVLKRGEDFDDVVLAIPVGALRTICSELVDRSPDWRRMVDGVKTIRTKSFQVWLKPSAEQAQWQSQHRIMTDVYENDFNSAADMIQTLPFEDWPADQTPGGVMYFSTAMKDDPAEPTTPDDAYQREQDALVGAEAAVWLSKWQEGLFGWLGPTPALDAYAHFYARANASADQRYVLSVAKSTQFRLRPDQSGFDNLFLAGDWTRSTLNLGCAEGATMSGLEAGRSVLRALAAEERAAAAGPPFIEYPGMPVYPPAYHQKGITLYQFVLDANADRLDEVVDRYLNPAAGNHLFRALGQWVILQSGHIAENSSDPPGTAFGTGAETSLTFLIPVARWRGWGAPGASPVDVGFFAPYIFVDHPLSLIAGREVLGMPKHLGVFEPVDSRPRSLDHMTMSTMVVNRLGRSSPVEQAPLVHIRREEAPTSLLSDWGSLPFLDMVERTIDTLVAASPLASLNPSVQIGTLFRELLGRPHIRFFSVRQLRDGREPTRAAFQEITCGRMDLGEVALRRPSMRHTIEIVPHASHPVAQQLGLASGLIKPVAELEVHIDKATLERAVDGQSRKANDA